MKIPLFLFDHVCVHEFRVDNGRDEAKSGAGEREVGDRGEETDGAGETAGSG